MVSITMMKKSFLRLIPILAAVIVGYIVATILGMVDFSVVSQAKWIGLSTEAASDLFTMPSMSFDRDNSHSSNSFSSIYWAYRRYYN